MGRRAVDCGPRLQPFSSASARNLPFDPVRTPIARAFSFREHAKTLAPLPALPSAHPPACAPRGIVAFRPSRIGTTKPDLGGARSFARSVLADVVRFDRNSRRGCSTAFETTARASPASRRSEDKAFRFDGHERAPCVRARPMAEPRCLDASTTRELDKLTVIKLGIGAFV